MSGQEPGVKPDDGIFTKPLLLTAGKTWLD
jgi:hypothetical protein